MAPQKKAKKHANSAKFDSLKGESTEQNEEERVKEKRRLELVIIIIIGITVLLTTWGQLVFFAHNSWIFFILLNINIILMLGILFLVGRNVIKLILERRRKIFGSRLRSKLVFAFLSISLFPIIIMFLAANRVIFTTVNYWFTAQVENSMQASLEVGQSFYTSAAERLQNNGSFILQDLTSTDQIYWDSMLAKDQGEKKLSLLGILEYTDTSPPTLTKQIWHSSGEFDLIWANAQSSMNWEKVARTGVDSLLWVDDRGDYVICAIPAPNLFGEGEYYIVLAENIGKGLLTQLQKISDGFGEYTQLKNLKNPLITSFTLTLGLLSLLVFLGSVWLAFRLSRDITRPILALSRQTEQIAQGNLAIQVEDSGKDELGQLVGSFNAMASEIRVSQENLKELNTLLEQRSQLLSERNKYIETVLEHITTGVITFDMKGKLLTMNNAAADIFQTRPAFWQGRYPAEYLPNSYAILFQLMYTVLKQNPSEPWEKEIEFVRRSTFRKILMRVIALPYLNFSDSSQSPESTGTVIMVVEDITKLSQGQRLAAWREVTTRIAHEIKNPLTPIKLSAQRIERKYAEQINDPVLSQCTGLIVKEVVRMQEMLKDLSSFASMAEIILKPGYIAPLLEEMKLLFETSHSKLTWSLNIAEPQLPIRMDKEALYKVLLNIMNNAAEAVQEKYPNTETGTVAIGAAGSGDEGKVDIHAYLTQNTKNETRAKDDFDIENVPQTFLVVEICDNGAGLTEEELVRLFEPYFSKKVTGTGLGLSIVRSIIIDHDADIQAENIPEGGTIIRMTFPCILNH